MIAAIWAPAGRESSRASRFTNIYAPWRSSSRVPTAFKWVDEFLELQPTEVQRRPADSLPMSPHDHLQARTQQQQQQQHREALRLALGSILASKRPPFNPSRSSSGACTPAFGMPSGAHTPANTPPMTGYYPLAHGPNSSDYLHPHHAYQHHGHAPLPPSRLARSSSSNSPTESAIPSSSSSAHPSPRTGATGAGDPVTLPLDLEPLPPAAVHATASPTDDAKHVRPSISPLHSDHGSGSGSESESSTHTGAGTPRAKFLQTLQSKSAWDALIHGSFS